MKTFKEFTEESLSEGTYEIATTKAKALSSSAKGSGLKVKTADDEGLVVVGKSAAVRKWLQKNDWDPEEINSILS